MKMMKMPIPRDIKLKCPICGHNKYVEDEHEDIFCIYCGLIIKSNYNYVAGIRIKSLSEILDEEKNKRIMKSRWRRIKNG